MKYKTQDIHNKNEHILVCLSASPSNARIVRTAARMASAFNGSFTALYVQTPAHEEMSNADKERLKYNSDLAREMGAQVVVLYSDDIPYQIAEYARISSVTKIVLGRSVAPQRLFIKSPSVTEKLLETAPDRDIYIIPDKSVIRYKPRIKIKLYSFLPDLQSIIRTVAVLLIATVIGMCFSRLNVSEANIITIYILGALITSLLTTGYRCGVLYSLASVLLFDYFFTHPLFTFHVHSTGYLFTFTVMLSASLISGSLANRLKSVAEKSTQSANRTRILLEATQLLQKADDEGKILDITATQIMKLLGRDVIVFTNQNGEAVRSDLYSLNHNDEKNIFMRFDEGMAVNFAMKNGVNTGAGTDHYPGVNGMYIPVVADHSVCGLIGIDVGSNPLESFEHSVVLSIIGECALSMENHRNAQAREQAASNARAERLRANLLRTISHDLRTPLTSISGNADTLMANFERMDKNQIKQAFEDIYNDSQWLITIVENILSVSRMEQNGMNLNLTDELVEDVVMEALEHFKKNNSHIITTDLGDDMLMARMDARLIVQVIVNLLDNGIKYTPAGSHIHISSWEKDSTIYVKVADNGPGVDEEYRLHAFEMFHTGHKKIADSRRSMGLGLSLCRSIINAHGGEITLTDNTPSGCIFIFTLPSSEVKLNEQ
ncbi:MAG: sensor histidine kinase KdpD [Oscillospiraceae bacterium]|nr:sensor histidine kinase KdpD [Oscillospiraceae bacterium]